MSSTSCALISVSMLCALFSLGGRGLGSEGEIRARREGGG